MDIIDLLQNKRNFQSTGSVSEEDIKRAEEMLSTSFSDEYIRLIANFGAVSFYGHELIGICKSKRLNVVDATLKYRLVTKNTDCLYVIENTNIDDILIWQSSDGEVFMTKAKSEPLKINQSIAEYLSER